MPAAPPRLRLRVNPLRAVAVLVLVLTLSFASAGTAAASSETYCGVIVDDVQPGEEPFEALQDMSDSFYGGIFGWFADQFGYDGDPATICVPGHFVVDQLAGFVVTKGVTGHPAGVILRVDRTLDAVEGAFSDHPVELPSELPAVGPTSVTVRVAHTDGLGLFLQAGPGLGYTSLALLPDGRELTVLCQVRGDRVGVTDTWDKVVVDGMTGYVSDNYTDGPLERFAQPC